MTYLPNTIIIDGEIIENVNYFDFSENMVVEKDAQKESKIIIRSKRGSNSSNIINNRYYSTPIESNLSTGVMQNNYMYAIPVLFTEGMELNRIGIALDKNEGNHSIQLGMYSNENGFPKNLILDAGTVGTLHGGEKEIVIDYKTPNNIIWLTASTSKNKIRPIAFDNLKLNAFLGRMIVKSESDISYVRGSQGFGNFPAVFPNPEYRSDNAPYIWVRQVN